MTYFIVSAVILILALIFVVLEAAAGSLRIHGGKKSFSHEYALELVCAICMLAFVLFLVAHLTLNKH